MHLITDMQALYLCHLCMTMYFFCHIIVRDGNCFKNGQRLLLFFEKDIWSPGCNSTGCCKVTLQFKLGKYLQFLLSGRPMKAVLIPDLPRLTRGNPIEQKQQ